MKYSTKMYPIHLDDGRTEWCVGHPDLKGCVGGGDTEEEAIKDAEKYKLYIKNT
jgi:predicted RNase H-like HicB family nuclease